jgi:hypothetical protein
MKNFTLIVLFVACLVLLGASCTTNNGPANNAAGNSGNLRLAFVTNNTSDFWTIARKGT